MQKKNILISAPTINEISFLTNKAKFCNDFYIIETSNTSFYMLVSGISSAITSFSLGKIFQKKKFDEAYQFGIAGSFNEKLAIGETVKIYSDTFADISFSNKKTPISKSNFEDFKNQPFSNGMLMPKTTFFENIKLPKASAITVNSVTTTKTQKEKWLKLYNPDIETMEGAAFYYCCMKENIPCVQIRTISNFVSDKKKDWEPKKAIDSLKTFVLNNFSI